MSAEWSLGKTMDEKWADITGFRAYAAKLNYQGVHLLPGTYLLKATPGTYPIHPRMDGWMDGWERLMSLLHIDA